MNEHLIEKVKNHQILYNQKLIEYRDQNLRYAVWQEIGNQLKIPANEAKERWDKLRRCFNNARNRRRENTKSGIIGKKKIIWKYEKQMEFLLPFLESRKTASNLNESQHSTITLEESDIDDTLPQHSERESDEENEETAQSKQHVSGGSRSKKRLRINKTPTKMAKILKDNFALKKQGCENCFVSSDILKKNMSILSKCYNWLDLYENKSNQLQSLDKMDMFFLSMSEVTKQLPKHDQARIKLQLSTAVLSAEMEQSCDNSVPSTFYYNSHSSPSTYCDDHNSSVEVVSLSAPEEN